MGLLLPLLALVLWCCAVVRLSELALAVAVLGEESALLLCVTASRSPLNSQTLGSSVRG